MRGNAAGNAEGAYVTFGLCVRPAYCTGAYRRVRVAFDAAATSAFRRLQRSATFDAPATSALRRLREPFATVDHEDRTGYPFTRW